MHFPLTPKGERPWPLLNLIPPHWRPRSGKGAQPLSYPLALKGGGEIPASLPALTSKVGEAARRRPPEGAPGKDIPKNQAASARVADGDARRKGEGLRSAGSAPVGPGRLLHRLPVKEHEAAPLQVSSHLGDRSWTGQGSGDRAAEDRLSLRT